MKKSVYNFISITHASPRMVQQWSYFCRVHESSIGTRGAPVQAPLYLDLYIRKAFEDKEKKIGKATMEEQQNLYPIVYIKTYFQK